MHSTRDPGRDLHIQPATTCNGGRNKQLFA